jgi:hypothetical protein
MVQKRAVRERFFSLELKSRDAIKTALLGNGNGDRVTVEGTIGDLKHAKFVEDTVLELVGTRGVLRVDLSMAELIKSSAGPQEADAR